MAGIWVRAGTVTLTNGSKKVTGYGTSWNTGTNKVGKGCAFIYNNIDYEVDYVNSDTELYLVDTYSGTTGSGLSYRIQIAVTDTIPELASRIATALAYWNGQAANLQALTTGSGNVTLTAPDGTQVTVPSYSGLQPKDELLTALAALTTSADKLVYFTGSDTVNQTTLTSFARTLLDDIDSVTARNTLGAQASDATLTALAGITTAADKLIYATGSDTFSTSTLTAFARTLLDDSNAATALGTLGAQPADATLTALAGVVTAADKLIYATGVDTFSTATLTAFARTVLAGTDASAMLSILGAASLSRTGTGGGFSFRNKIVDGRFDFWYEGTTQSTNGYGSDTMWMNIHGGSTKVHSQQPLVAGVDLPAIDCPAATYFSRTVVTSVAGAANYVVKTQNIEGVGTLAGKVVTLSFYAKADAVKNIAVTFTQNFGTGGSTAITGIGAQLISLSTAWKRYSVQVTLPSISGKTLGTGHLISVLFGFDIGSNYAAAYASLGQQSGTFDLACIQLEEGTVATPFEELPIEVSSSRVDRYFQQWSGPLIFPAFVSSSGNATFNAYLQQRGKMRTSPSCAWNLSDSNFAAPPAANQWGLVLDGIAWTTHNGTISSISVVASIGGGVRINGNNSVAFSNYPSGIYLNSGMYINLDARL